MIVFFKLYGLRPYLFYGSSFSSNDCSIGNNGSGVAGGGNNGSGVNCFDTGSFDFNAVNSSFFCFFSFVVARNESHSD